MVQSQPLPEMAQFDNISKIENDLRFRKTQLGNCTYTLRLRQQKSKASQCISVWTKKLLKQFRKIHYSAMLPAHKGTSSINSKSHRFHPRNINSCTIRWTTWNHISIVSTWISQSLTCKTWTELLEVASRGTKTFDGNWGNNKRHLEPVTKLLDTLRGVNLRLRITFVYSIRLI